MLSQRWQTTGVATLGPQGALYWETDRGVQ